jgi:hypothetical protein
MITTIFIPRSMRSDRPQVREPTIELSDAEIRKAVKVPPAEHAAAQDAQVEACMASASREDLCDWIRQLRRELAGAQFAARTNADTIKSMWRAR